MTRTPIARIKPKVFSGVVDPDAGGVAADANLLDGDWYLNTATHNAWTFDSNAGWTGFIGGTQWYIGPAGALPVSGLPTPNVPPGAKAGDMYYDPVTFVIYQLVDTP